MNKYLKPIPQQSECLRFYVAQCNNGEYQGLCLPSPTDKAIYSVWRSTLAGAKEDARVHESEGRNVDGIIRVGRNGWKLYPFESLHVNRGPEWGEW